MAQKIQSKTAVVASVEDEGAQGVNKNKEPVIVSCGLHDPLSLQIAGKKVGEVRKQLSTPWNMSAELGAVVSGKKVDEEYVLNGGDRLEFVKNSGEKG